MYATVVKVTIAAGQVDAAQQVLREQIVPRISQSPGFVKGFWTTAADGTNGLSLIVWDSQQSADNGAKMIGENPMPPGVTFNNVEVREVVAEA